jgi:eukaryotic-like serine/threonine-protein kinase
MSPNRWDRFRTGQALKGKLLQDLVDQAGAGAILSAGTMVGPWRTVELLGSGGMAHVYLAERADGQFEQQVALKLVRKNLNLINRLRHERQIVATLRHPHIVSLVDGGETAEGDLWFAMAVVDGLPIDQYAADQKLGWRARLQLFDAVSGAVEYAHGRALIHRDIKPANILVDSHGHPRLLDFGIALDDGGGDGSNDHVLTPGFASPEQLAGQTITIASDIYQLGLVLRTLLGEAQGGSAFTIDMPSTVRADLARVIARSTAVDTQARYPTVAALREDISSLLTRRPLAQDRESTVRRMARFVERNRVSFAVGVLALVTLITISAIAALRLRDERNQAIANEQRANSVSEFLVSTLTQANPYSPQKGAISVLDAMDHAAATLDDSLVGSPDLRRELRATIGEVYLNLDEYARCLDLLGADQASGELAAASATDQARTMILRSECHLALDQRDEAWHWLESAQAALKAEKTVTADQLRAFILVDRGQLLSLNGKLVDANQEFRKALQLAEQSGSVEQEYRANRMLGNNLQSANDDLAAVARLQRALELATRTLGPTHRSTLTTAGSLALTLGKLQRWDEAGKTLLGAMAAAEQTRHRDATPDIVIAQLRDDYATLLWQQGRLEECFEQARSALAIYQRMAPASSSQGFNPSWRAATCAYQMRRLEVAEDYGKQALHYGENGVPVGVINALRLLAASAARRDRLAEAADYLARADAALTHTEVANKGVFAALDLTRALLAVRGGDITAARTYLQQADASIRDNGFTTGWLPPERADIAAMIEAAH